MNEYTKALSTVAMETAAKKLGREYILIERSNCEMYDGV